MIQEQFAAREALIFLAPHLSPVTKQCICVGLRNVVKAGASCGTIDKMTADHTETRRMMTRTDRHQLPYCLFCSLQFLRISLRPRDTKM